jgi:uncharacterized protein (DUF58 family)
MNIAWIIVVLFLTFFIQGVVTKKWGLKGIRYHRYFERTSVFEGEKVVMVDEIMNRKILPVAWLRLETKMNSNLMNEESIVPENKGMAFHRTLFSLLPYQKITRRHQLIGKKRGYYPHQSVSVTVGDVMGYGEVFDSLTAHTAITVYPKFVPIEDIPLPSHSWLGDITVKRWIIEDPFLHAGVREYQQGDSLNSINWKATARSQVLQINKKDYTADHNLLIYVNFDVNEDLRLPMEQLDVIEKALSYAASLANYTIKQGIATGFGCNGYYVEPFVNSIDKIKPSVRIEPSSSGQQEAFILDAIAKVKMDRSHNFSEFLQEDIDRELTNTDIIIFAYELTEKVEQQIAKLEQLDNAVEIVTLAHEARKVAEEDAS